MIAYILVFMFISIEYFHPCSGLELEVRDSLRSTITPRRVQVANITRSKVDYLRTDSLISYGFQIPASRGVNFKFQISGSVRLTGFIGEKLDGKLKWLSKNVSRSMEDFYKTEQKKLKSRAGPLYFSWLQAAANFGYSADSYTKEFVNKRAFKEFNRRAAGMLRRLKEQQLVARVRATVSGVSNGQKYIFAYIRVNTITIKSGKTITFVNLKPLIFLTGDNGKEVDILENITLFSKVKVESAHIVIENSNDDDDIDEAMESPSA